MMKIHRKINHADSSNRRLAKINVRGSCNCSKHKCIADTSSIRRSAVACRTDTGEDVAQDYPVIRPRAALRRGFKQHWKLSLYSKKDLTEG
ncbi:hypothetical protein P5V15_006213 [Pogonomyrmex californicus]